MLSLILTLHFLNCLFLDRHMISHCNGPCKIINVVQFSLSNAVGAAAVDCYSDGVRACYLFSAPFVCRYGFAHYRSESPYVVLDNRFVELTFLSFNA